MAEFPQMIEQQFGRLLQSQRVINCKLITKSDTVDLEHPGYVFLPIPADTGLVVNIVTMGGDVVPLTLATNEIIPILAKRVLSTSTTANNIYILY